MMWVLMLNDMRAAQIDNLSPIVRAETREQLDAFVAQEKVEPYNDGSRRKTYRQGGPLEWFNPPFESDSHHFINVGTREDAARRWDDHVMGLPPIDALRRDITQQGI